MTSTASYPTAETAARWEIRCLCSDGTYFTVETDDGYPAEDRARHALEEILNQWHPSTWSTATGDGPEVVSLTVGRSNR